MPFLITSAAFAPNKEIPRHYTCDGMDVSPPLNWSGAPRGTRSFALVCSDPDAPSGTFQHWAAWDIPADYSGLPEDFPKEGRDGIRQAVNDFGRVGFGGPCPPQNHGIHHYHFRLYALDVDMLPNPGKSPSCRDVERALRPHVLAEAEVVGLYQR
ncbi:MAG: YbhB/YbcL family Raf kinase inhibitor-like protein [Rhodospirillales bacterium]|nr:YbhB/YbcL family Raf kinase inhibitor-like protein [Rhodospirillales bacterium]